MLLPISLSLRWIATITLFIVELLAVLWLKRKLLDTNRSRGGLGSLCPLRRCLKGRRPGFWRDPLDVGPQRPAAPRYGGRARGEHEARQERQMTLQVSSMEKHAGVWIAERPNRQPLDARTGPGEAAGAARTLPLAGGSDAGTPR
jgi:hypothetical protein